MNVLFYVAEPTQEMSNALQKTFINSNVATKIIWLNAEYLNTILPTASERTFLYYVQNYFCYT